MMMYFAQVHFRNISEGKCYMLLFQEVMLLVIVKSFSTTTLQAFL